MNEINGIRIKLIEFRDCDKFKVYIDLQPAIENSTEEDKKYVNDEMNLCSNQLLQYLEQTNLKDEDLKNIVRNSLEKIEYAYLDTEDREFCYELYFKIGEILGIDIEDKSKSIEQKLMDDLQSMMKKSGINPNNILKDNPA